MGRKLTNEEFLQKLKDLGRDDLVPLEEYKGRHTKIKFKCTKEDCQNEWYVQPGNIFKGNGCPKCGIKKRTKNRTFTHEEFMKNFMKTGNKNIKIIGKYQGCDNYIECECSVNKAHPHFLKSAYSLLQGSGCPYCSNAKVTEERKLKNICPELMIYLKNTNDGEYSYGSKKIIEVICPNCGYNKKISIGNLTQRGFSCPICGDGISYPNRVLRKLLLDDSIKKQVNNIEIEWRPLNWGKRCFFDGKIEINGLIICIEMQGKQHKTGMWGGKNKKDIIKRDEYKRKKCKESGYIEIEIDCEKTSFKDIKKEILKSDLKKYLDFSEVNWEKISDMSWNSLLIQICEKYDNSFLSVGEIGEFFNLGKRSINQYIQRGLKAGIIKKYSLEDSSIRRRLYFTKYVYELYNLKGELLAEDIGLTFFQNSIEKITGVKIPQKNLVGNKSGTMIKLKNYKIKKRLKTYQDREKLSKKYLTYLK